MTRSHASSLESISIFEIAVMKPTTSDQSKAPPIKVTSAIEILTKDSAEKNFHLSVF